MVKSKWVRKIIKNAAFGIAFLYFTYFFLLHPLFDDKEQAAPQRIINVDEKAPEAYMLETPDNLTIVDYDENSFIQESLNIDETADNLPYQITEMISSGATLEIDGKNIKDIKDIYELYEEELPEDVLVDKPKTAIDDVPPEIDKKPAHFEQPVIAIVIDDMGISRQRTKDIASLHYPITASFLTYGNGLNGQVEKSLKAGQEIMVHVPMQAKSNDNEAPDVLKITMNEDEVKTNLANMLAKFKDIKGINNHMGSLFTENAEHMGYVMDVLKEKELFFLDSRTSSKSAGKEEAFRSGVPYVQRNVFLDNKNDFDYIMGQLKTTEKLARKNSYAVAIGHPKSQTYEALKAWLPTLEEKGIKLLPLSEIVETVNK